MIIFSLITWKNPLIIVKKDSIVKMLSIPKTIEYVVTCISNRMQDVILIQLNY